MENTMNNATVNASINTTTEEERTMDNTAVNATVNAENQEENAMENNTVAIEEVEVLENNAMYTDMLASSASPSVGQLVQKIKKGLIVFDNAVQRSLVWTPDKKSLLIDSVLCGIILPPMVGVKDTVTDKNGKSKVIFDMIDGKQRANAFYEFANDGFTLNGVRNVVLDDDSLFNPNGKKFSELPDEIKDRINGTKLSITLYENVTDEEIADLFMRYNNGKPLSAIELTRVRSKELSTIQEVGKHELFDSALTKKALARYTNEDIVIKTDMMLRVPRTEICLDNKAVRPYTENVHLGEEEINTLNEVFDYILEVYTELTEDADKATTRIAKKMLVRTHMISLVPFVKEAIDKEIPEGKFGDWVMSFYGGKIDPSYTSNASSGSNHHSQVEARRKALEKSFNAFFTKAVLEEIRKAAENTEDDNAEETVNAEVEEAVKVLATDEEISDAELAELAHEMEKALA